MDNDLTCALCEQQYTDANPPRLLITCGHTFCQKCVKKIITEKKGSYKLVCPEDGEMISLKDNNINNFPKNIALMKILQSKKNSEFHDPYLEMSKIVKNQQQQEDEDTRDLVASIISPNNTKYISQDAIKLENKEEEGGEEEEETDKKEDKKENHKKEEKGKTSLSSTPDKVQKVEKPQKQKKQQREMCLLHQKPLQVVCVIDLKKICASCAIFGEHKGHDFKSIEEIQKQRVDYYHAILNIMDKKQNITERISNEQTCSSIMDILTKKKETMKKGINEKYQKLLTTIQSKQKESMKNLQNVITKTESKLKNLMKIDATTMQKYDKWQQKSYKEIKILQGDDFESKLHLLFVGANTNQTDVLEQGDIIIEQMYKQEQNLINEVELALENIGVDYNQEIFNHIDGFIEIYDEAKKKKSKVSRVGKTESQQTGQMSSTVGSKMSGLSAFKKQEDTTQSRLSEEKNKVQQPQPAKNQQQKSPKNPHIVVHHQQQSLLQMLQDIDVRKIESEQLTPKNIKHEEMLSYSMRQTPEKNQFTSDIKLNLSSEIKIEKLKEQKIHTVEPVSIKKEENTITRHKSPQLTQRSEQKDTSFTQQKIERPNKKKLLSKIKISEKYTKILEGLANDQLETVDFTNAEMGDANAILICEFLNGSKAKTVKLISNKLNDETLQKILPHMGGVITLNISQNFLTERALDIIYACKDYLVSVKSIILCQNKIIERKHKAKIDKLKALGYTVSV